MRFKAFKASLLCTVVLSMLGANFAAAEQYEYSERMSDAELDRRVTQGYDNTTNNATDNTPSALGSEYYETSEIDRDGRFYIGGGIGQSYLDIDPKGSGIRVSDDSDLAKEFFAGYSFNKYFALEGYYVDLGTADLKFDPGFAIRSNGGFTKGEIDYSTWGLSGIFAYPIFAETLNESLRAFLKVGYSKYESDHEDLGDFVKQDEDDGVHWGAGLEYALTDNLALRAHYTSLDGDDAKYWAGDIVYYFGYKKPEPVEIIEPVITPQQQLIDLAKNVYFVNDKAELTTSAMRALDAAANILNTHRNLNITIGAHTDSNASDKYNLDLSDRRAKSVARYLISRGVAATRMASRGFGESRPIATNSTPEGRAQNRRVEIRTVN